MNKKTDKLGNPAAMMLAPVASKAGEKGLDFFSKNYKTVLVTLGAAALTYFGYKSYKSWRLDKFLEENGHKPDVQAAMIIYKAIHKIDLGFISNWVNIPDGTDIDALYNLAINIESVINVQRAYKEIFGLNLYQDINSDLSSDELVEFYNLLKVNENSGQTNQAPFYLIGQDIFARKNTGANVTIAEKDSNGNWYNTQEFYQHYDYGDKIGEIIAIVEDAWQPEKTAYVVDINWSFTEDWISHDEVETKS